MMYQVNKNTSLDPTKKEAGISRGKPDGSPWYTFRGSNPGHPD